MNRILFIACILLAACGQGDKTKKDTSARSQRQLPSWLAGRWQVLGPMQDGGLQVEEWKRIDDSTYIGSSYLVSGADTSYAESIRLEEYHGSLLYTATVPDQNGGAPVIFTRSGSGDSVYTFVNEKHDFPSRISYRLVRADSVLAYVEGKGEGGAVQKQEIPLRRLR